VYRPGDCRGHFWAWRLLDTEHCSLRDGRGQRRSRVVVVRQSGHRWQDCKAIPLLTCNTGNSTLSALVDRNPPRYRINGAKLLRFQKQCGELRSSPPPKDPIEGDPEERYFTRSLGQVFGSYQDQLAIHRAILTQPAMQAPFFHGILPVIRPNNYLPDGGAINSAEMDPRNRPDSVLNKRGSPAQIKELDNLERHRLGAIAEQRIGPRRVNHVWPIRNGIATISRNHDGFPL